MNAKPDKGVGVPGKCSTVLENIAVCGQKMKQNSDVCGVEEDVKAKSNVYSEAIKDQTLKCDSD